LNEEAEMISRERLKKDIVDQLYWDDRVDVAKVLVETEDNGRVRLSGTVPNFTAYRAAESDALAVRGVKTVQNQLRVSFPSDLAVEDEEITAGISGGLLWYPNIDASKIEVTVNAGTVTLSGTVDSYWKKLKAEELAFDTGGVVWVINELAVVPTRDFTDELIAENVIGALRRHSVILDPDSINVFVENGVVTLSGHVPDRQALKAAEDAARFTPGVVEVSNSLVVT
jgi:hyperosmotically inducible periplasmic protein